MVFGNVNIGSSANQNITITNNGNSTTTITQVGVNGQHVIASGFSTPLALAPSQSVTLNVQYSPAAANSLNGSISIVSAQGQTTMVTVTGSGAQATLAVSPGSVSFSNVVTGSTNSQSVQISNAGNASLTITQANISGSGFSTTGLSLPLALAAGQSSSFNLQFIAQSAGTVGGTLSLVSNAANSTASVALSGSSIASTKTLQVSASSLNFGSVTAGSSSSKTIVLTNTGNADVTISQIGVSGTNFALTGAGAVTLSSGQSDSFGVQYSPTGTETDNGSVSIVSNASGGLQRIPHNHQWQRICAGEWLAGGVGCVRGQLSTEQHNILLRNNGRGRQRHGKRLLQRSAGDRSVGQVGNQNSMGDELAEVRGEPSPKSLIAAPRGHNVGSNSQRWGPTVCRTRHALRYRIHPCTCFRLRITIFAL